MAIQTESDTQKVVEALAQELKAAFNQDCADWDEQVNRQQGSSLPGGAGLWDNMPTLDSKAVSRSSPIFEKHLGIPLDAKLIKPGGYANATEAVDHLVPLMVKKAAKAEPKGGKKRE